MNLKLILKALGIKFEQAHVDQIEALIPQIPTIVNQGINLINSAVKNFDERLARIEIELKEMRTIQETIYAGRTNRDRESSRANGIHTGTIDPTQ